MDEKRFALIIANSEYKDPDLQKLMAASLDAEALANVLRNPEIGEFEVKALINKHLLCRNIGCVNYPELPYRRYCSKKCNREFRRWYYNNFYWDNVRLKIFKRDKYTCQICKIEYSCRRHKWFNRHRDLECDHIVPKSLFEQRGYKFDTLENKVKATIEFFHNPSNLRTLCYHCHRRVTAGYLRTKHDPPKQK